MANFKNEIRLVLDKLRPKYENNTDPLIFDYDFFTELEKYAKKERADKLHAVIKDPESLRESGRIVRGKAWALDLKVDPTNSFDKEVFIDNIIEHYKDKVSRPILREIAGKSLKSGERKSFKAVNREDE